MSVVFEWDNLCIDFLKHLKRNSRYKLSEIRFKIQGAIMLNREVGENPTRSRRCEGWRKANLRRGQGHCLQMQVGRPCRVGWSPSQKTCPEVGTFSCGRQEKEGVNLIGLLLGEKRVSPPKKAGFFIACLFKIKNEKRRHNGDICLWFPSLREK